MFAAMLLYVGVLFGALAAARGMEPGPVLTLLAILPMVPMVLAVIAYLRFFRRMDERQQRSHADAAALTLMIGILASIALGFLKRFGVLDFEDDMMWFGPFLIVAWGAARMLLGERC